MAETASVSSSMGAVQFRHKYLEYMASVGAKLQSGGHKTPNAESVHQSSSLRRRRLVHSSQTIPSGAGGESVSSLCVKLDDILHATSNSDMVAVTLFSDGGKVFSRFCEQVIKCNLSCSTWSMCVNHLMSLIEVAPTVMLHSALIIDSLCKLLGMILNECLVKDTSSVRSTMEQFLVSLCTLSIGDILDYYEIQVVQKLPEEESFSGEQVQLVRSGAAYVQNERRSDLMSKTGKELMGNMLFPAVQVSSDGIVGSGDTIINIKKMIQQVGFTFWRSVESRISEMYVQTETERDTNNNPLLRGLLKCGASAFEHQHNRSVVLICLKSLVLVLNSYFQTIDNSTFIVSVVPESQINIPKRNFGARGLNALLPNVATYIAQHQSEQLHKTLDQLISLYDGATQTGLSKDNHQCNGDLMMIGQSLTFLESILLMAAFLSHTCCSMPSTEDQLDAWHLSPTVWSVASELLGSFDKPDVRKNVLHRTDILILQFKQNDKLISKSVGLKDFMLQNTVQSVLSLNKDDQEENNIQPLCNQEPIAAARETTRLVAFNVRCAFVLILVFAFYEDPITMKREYIRAAKAVSTQNQDEDVCANFVSKASCLLQLLQNISSFSCEDSKIDQRFTNDTITIFQEWADKSTDRSSASLPNLTQNSNDNANKGASPTTTNRHNKNPGTPSPKSLLKRRAVSKPKQDF